MQICEYVGNYFTPDSEMRLKKNNGKIDYNSDKQC